MATRRRPSRAASARRRQDNSDLAVETSTPQSKSVKKPASRSARQTAVQPHSAPQPEAPPQQRRRPVPQSNSAVPEPVAPASKPASAPQRRPSARQPSATPTPVKRPVSVRRPAETGQAIAPTPRPVSGRQKTSSTSRRQKPVSGRRPVTEASNRAKKASAVQTPRERIQEEPQEKRGSQRSSAASSRRTSAKASGRTSARSSGKNSSVADNSNMKKIIFAVLAIVVIGGGVFAFTNSSDGGDSEVATTPTQESIFETVQSTMKRIDIALLGNKIEKAEAAVATVEKALSEIVIPAGPEAADLQAQKDALVAELVLKKEDIVRAGQKDQVSMHAIVAKNRLQNLMREYDLDLLRKDINAFINNPLNPGQGSDPEAATYFASFTSSFVDYEQKITKEIDRREQGGIVSPDFSTKGDDNSIGDRSNRRVALGLESIIKDPIKDGKFYKAFKAIKNYSESNPTANFETHWKKVETAMVNAWPADKAKAEKLIASGDKEATRTHLWFIIDNYGVESYMEQAREMLHSEGLDK